MEHEAKSRQRHWELSRTDGHVYRCDLEFERVWTAWILLDDETVAGQPFESQASAAEWSDDLLVRLGASVPAVN